MFPLIKPISGFFWMWGCDLSDQLMTSYWMLCRSVKWWRKLFFHRFILLVNNAYGLHKKFGSKPVHIPKCSHSKTGSKRCSACNFGKKELKPTGHTSSLKCKFTSYHCSVCKVPWCIEPCFKTYHKLANIKEVF